jgi:hypothetical protein
MVDNLNCDLCQRNKLDGKGYGFLPEHEVRSITFEECTVDLIRPWKVQVHGKPHKFKAFDVPVQDPKSKSQVKIPIQDPKPRFQTKNTSHIVVCMLVCLFAPFTNTGMENDSQKCHIRDVCTAANNPQSNAICKRIHQAIGNILRQICGDILPNIWGHVANTKYMGTDC